MISEICHIVYLAALLKVVDDTGDGKIRSMVRLTTKFEQFY